MESKLEVMSGKALFEGEGGAYYHWPTSEYAALGNNKVGAGKLVLQPRGFALPHYADSSKLGFVIQGTDGVAGVVLPKQSEKVVDLKKGDVIALHHGSVSWWFNNGDSPLEIVFLGETTKALVPGEISYFFLTGAQGVLSSLSIEFVSKIYNLNEDEATQLATSQTGVLIVKLKQGQKLPNPNTHKDIIKNINRDANGLPKTGIVSLTESEFPFLREVGLSAKAEKIKPNGVSSLLGYGVDAIVELIYVANGGGWVQIVGGGQKLLDAQVKAGDVVVVPRFFVAAKIANGDGMDCLSIVTSARPVFEDLIGKASAWEALSPQVLQAALNVSPEFEQLFRSKARR